jgi:hypothetical protein
LLSLEKSLQRPDEEYLNDLKNDLKNDVNLGFEFEGMNVGMKGLKDVTGKVDVSYKLLNTTDYRNLVRSASLQVLISLFNNIVVPCAATAAISPKVSLKC